jgi:hypothetical protein
VVKKNNEVAANTSAQIFQFPSIINSDGFSTNSPEQVSSNVLDLKLMAIEDTLEFVVPMLFETLAHAGIKVNDDFVAETMIGLLRGIMNDHFHIDDPIINFLQENKEIIEIKLNDQFCGADIGADELS